MTLFDKMSMNYQEKWKHFCNTRLRSCEDIRHPSSFHYVVTGPSSFHFSLLRQLADTPRQDAVTGRNVDLLPHL